MPAQYAKSMALTPELNRLVDALVASGEHDSASEGMRDGSPAPIDRRERSAAELAEIRVRMACGLAEADCGDDAQGTGKEAMRRAFEPASRELADESWRLTRAAERSRREAPHGG